MNGNETGSSIIVHRHVPGAAGIMWGNMKAKLYKRCWFRAIFRCGEDPYSSSTPDYMHMMETTPRKCILRLTIELVGSMKASTQSARW